MQGDIVSIPLVTPFSAFASLGVIVTSGVSTSYCAEFGGDEKKNDDRVTKRKSASAPVACPTQEPVECCDFVDSGFYCSTSSASACFGTTVPGSCDASGACVLGTPAAGDYCDLSSGVCLAGVSESDCASSWQGSFVANALCTENGCVP
jgi:hypothetical protein